MLKPGMMLGDRYEIIELVGSGGMSEVYKAKDHKLNRYVAAKVLKNEFSDDRNFVSKFRVEAQSAAGLAHPNIVNVYDVGEDEGIYYIVMEYVEGITLKDYIYDHGRLTVEEALDFSLQIASGIEVAHQNHTIHRDIKPQNIIVSKNGTLKITDFGIARAATSNTVASNAMGSVHYISPEQARGGYSDEKSDIYSLGITMYEMVTGRVPFEGDNNVTVALMHIQGEMIPPREYYPDIPASFEKVILKCTQKKPERRYLTASALIADLRRVATNPNGDFVVLGDNSSKNSPTRAMSKEELETIKESTVKRPYEEPAKVTPYVEPQTSAYSNSRMEPPVQEEEEPDYYEEDDGPDEDFDPRDEDYKTDYDRYLEDEPDEEEDDDRDYGREKNEDDEDIDPALKKLVMVGGIVSAVLIAMIIMLIVGKMAGWFKFGSNSGSGNSNKDPQQASTGEVVDNSVLMTENVEGLLLEAAETLLTKAQIPYIVEYQKSDTIDVGRVISQSYQVGQTIPEGENAKIIVSAGKEEVDVPNVVGYEVEQAETLLHEAELAITHAYEYSEDVEKDRVISQEPGSTSKVAKGTKVKIVISNGSEKKDTEVPDLRGRTQAEAQAMLQNAKLELGNVNEEYSSDYPEGQVFAQSMSSGTSVPEGSKIDITISKGAEPTEEPSTEPTTEEPKTYSATFAGAITFTGEEDSTNSYNVEVRYVIGDTIKSVVSGNVSAQNPTLEIPSTYTVSGLSAPGTLQVLYNGATTRPEDVQESVNVQVTEE